MSEVTAVTLDGGARTVSGPNIRRLTLDEYRAEATARFGPDIRRWAFLCPHCGDVATVADFIEAGADGRRAGQECIGRVLGALTGTASRGCDWAANGLFAGPWFVDVPPASLLGALSESTVASFAFAPSPEPGEVT